MEDEVKVLKKIIDIRQELIELNNQLTGIKNKVFTQARPFVSREHIKYNVKEKVKFKWWLAILIFYITAGIGTLVYWFIIDNKRNKLFEEEYTKRLEECNNIEIPKYEEEYRKWKELQKTTIQILTDKINTMTNELEKIYNESKILPVQYRNFDAEVYIYNIISTSNYSVIQAIDNYDRNIQLDLDMKRLNELKQSNVLASDNNKMMVKQNNLITKQNETLEKNNELTQETNYLLKKQNAKIDKMRKHNDLANMVGIVQSHNTNSLLKDLNDD